MTGKKLNPVSLSLDVDAAMNCCVDTNYGYRDLLWKISIFPLIILFKKILLYYFEVWERTDKYLFRKLYVAKNIP